MCAFKGGFCVCFCVGFWRSFMQIWKSCAAISPSSKCHLWLFTDKMVPVWVICMKALAGQRSEIPFSFSPRQTRTHRYQFSGLIWGVFNAHLFSVLAEPKLEDSCESWVNLTTSQIPFSHHTSSCIVPLSVQSFLASPLLSFHQHTAWSTA